MPARTPTAATPAATSTTPENTAASSATATGTTDQTPATLDGTPVVTAEEGEVKVTHQGQVIVLEAVKDGVSYRLQGTDEKAVRAYFKANPEKCIAGK